MSGTGVKLKRRPIVGLPEDGLRISRTQERKFGLPQGSGGILAAAEAIVKSVHKLARGRSIADFPQRAYDVMSASA